jgi:FtsP/CotA-like multicopper oxidase with cupredoxin domain
MMLTHESGIEQTNTPWSDGVPGLSQQPIQPGSKFVYRWTANYYGTYFYHAHERSHMNDGLYGAIYVRPNDSQPRPFSLITNDTKELEALRQAEQKTAPVILSDWSHQTSEEIWNIEEEANLDAYCTNALLINGKGSVTCLSQSYINANTNPAAAALLNGSHLTDMGYVRWNYLH